MKYARIKKNMFVYFYNFQSFGIPVYLGKSTCLSLTYLWLKCLLFQERKQRGPWGCRPLLRVGGPRVSLQRTQLGRNWRSGSLAPTWELSEVLSSMGSVFSHGTSFLSVASFNAKKNEVGVFFRSSDCAAGCGAALCCLCSGRRVPQGTHSLLQSCSPVCSPQLPRQTGWELPVRAQFAPWFGL